MPRKKNDKVMEEVEELNNSNEVVKSVDKQVEVKEEPVQVLKDEVEVQVVTKIKCYIGNKWYSFEPNTKYYVPLNVKEHLARMRILRLY